MTTRLASFRIQEGVGRARLFELAVPSRESGDDARILTRLGFSIHVDSCVVVNANVWPGAIDDVARPEVEGEDPHTRSVDGVDGRERIVPRHDVGGIVGRREPRRTY